MLGSPSSPIVLAAIDNGGVLYDEIQVGFVVYYSPLAWSNQSQNSIVIRLNEV